MAGPAAPAPSTIPALMAAVADRFPDRPAVRADGADLSFSQLQSQVKRFAAALVSAGVQPRDRVAIWAPNSTEWIVAVLGLLHAGATLVPINTRFKGPEAAGILGRAHVRALVTVTDFLGNDYPALLRSSGVELPDLGLVVVAHGPVPPGAVGWDPFLAGGEAGSAGEADRRAEALGPETPSDILFTSGTTGTPKGVVMTHSRTLRVATDWVAMTGLGPDDRYLMVNPYFHMFGLKAGILACLAAGATMLPEPVLDVERVLRRVQSEGVTVLPGPPTLYQTILDHPDAGRYDLGSLRVAVTGSADIPVELIKRVRAELPFRTIVSGYGLTEAGTATGTGPDDDFEAIATTVGRPRPGFEVRLAPGGGAVAAPEPDAGPGETGEIWLRGASVMSHYLDDPDATAEALTHDGWLRTGDLGTWDGEGRLRIVGRLKDMFIVGGFNAYPAEIENLMMGHPGIGQVAVIGVPDQRLGEVGVAFVVARRGADLTPPGVIAWSREIMANYKVPRSVVLVDELPLTATGKVHKDRLRALLQDR